MQWKLLDSCGTFHQNGKKQNNNATQSESWTEIFYCEVDHMNLIYPTVVPFCQSSKFGHFWTTIFQNAPGSFVYRYIQDNNIFETSMYRKFIKKCYKKYNCIFHTLPKRGSTQREALAHRSVEKNLELIFYFITHPILVPKWPHWWGLSNGRFWPDLIILRWS